MHEHHYQQLCHKFLGSYRLRAYLIMRGNFLTPCLHIFLVLRRSGTNLSVFGLFIIAPILIFEGS